MAAVIRPYVSQDSTSCKQGTKKKTMERKLLLLEWQRSSLFIRTNLNDLASNFPRVGRQPFTTLALMGKFHNTAEANFMVISRQSRIEQIASEVEEMDKTSR